MTALVSNKLCMELYDGIGLLIGGKAPFVQIM